MQDDNTNEYSHHSAETKRIDSIILPEQFGPVMRTSGMFASRENGACELDVRHDAVECEDTNLFFSTI